MANQNDPPIRNGDSGQGITSPVHSLSISQFRVIKFLISYRLVENTQGLAHGRGRWRGGGEEGRRRGGGRGGVY